MRNLSKEVERNNLDHFRTYVSTAFYCPFEKKMNISKSNQIIRYIADYCDEVVVSDTTGQATTTDCLELLELLQASLNTEQVACHFHNTYGTALANYWMAHTLGYRTFDTSISGLGGCPYSPGASGNISTEDVAYNFETGVSMQRLLEAAITIEQIVGKSESSLLRSISRRDDFTNPPKIN